MEGVVLVLNQNYEPLNVCNLPRAFRLVFGDRAEVLEYDHQMIRTPRASFRAPAVIRLQNQIRLPRPRVKLTRREVFARDNYTCQYCGVVGAQLTVDHVNPRSRGGQTSWENVVCSCRSCNARKGDRLPHEAGMMLLRVPRKPRFFHPEAMNPRLSMGVQQHWSKYLRSGEPS